MSRCCWFTPSATVAKSTVDSEDHREPTVHRFLVVIEKPDGNYSAYSPDLSGCIATGATRDEAESNMREVVKMHVSGLIEDGLPFPESESASKYDAV